MTATALHPSECVSALTAAYPIEDIWLLDSSAYPDADLDPLTLVCIVPQDEEAHEIEPEANKLLREKFGPDAPFVAVFPRSAIERLPRPLLVKMALGKGQNIHCG